MMSYRRRRGTPSSTAAALRQMGACAPPPAARPYAAWKRSHSSSRSLLQAAPAHTGFRVSGISRRRAPVRRLEALAQQQQVALAGRACAYRD